MVNIYNSLSKTKESVESKGTINMYSCGVTVYDACHIGHARSLYVFDVIRKYLQYRGYKVNFIRNITDIDDKIINKANELKKDWREVVSENISSYQRDLESLGLGNADSEPRATDNIKEMILHIEGLIKKEHAYVVDGDVYFNVRSFKDYGKLSGQSIEKMMDAVRIGHDQKKRDPLDFALWKKSKEGEPFWPSPWGDGRPGWHMECSVMSMKYAKTETLDIHAGGRDLVFPHHENEIAQSEALTGKKFAKCWIHHGLLTINKQKMAKSLGNFITIEDAVSKYGANVLKLFFLSSHYASNIDFSEEKMEDARKNCKTVARVIERLKKESSSEESSRPGAIDEYKEEFLKHMDDDFNTPGALAVLFDAIHKCHQELDEGRVSGLGSALSIINEMVNIFGLVFIEEEGLTEEEEKLISDRVDARKNKDFKLSDEIRDMLQEKGIMVKDTKDGQQWERI